MKAFIFILWLGLFVSFSTPVLTLDCTADRCLVGSLTYDTTTLCAEINLDYDFQMDELALCEQQRLENGCCVINENHWSDSDQEAERFFGAADEGATMVFWQERAELTRLLRLEKTCEPCRIKELDFYLLEFMLANCQIRLLACGFDVDIY
ncbi:MAG TPA: hypothetical protein PKY08_02730 [Candidatus Magasanikbacteria bacterium]|nr:hypothetical protein [Candidatus Magasanikbacteria bacterium]